LRGDVWNANRKLSRIHALAIIVTIDLNLSLKWGKMMLPLAIAICITVLDQLTKHLIRGHFDLYEGIVIIPGFFDFRYIKNTGAAWGMFSGMHYWLALLSVVVLIAMIIWRKSLFRETMIDRMAFGLLIGGIVGNFIDRVRLEYVVDFLDFHFKGRHFPAFNVADSAICIGVALIMLSQYILARSMCTKPAPAKETPHVLP
jgi:signal peptidase II